MKTTFIHDLKERSFLFILLLFMIFSLGSCAKKVAFSVSSVIPAAEGAVKVKTDKNENYEIDLNVKNIARPERLQPPKKVYIAWMETQGGPMSLGQLSISGNLTGSLETARHQKPTKIFITAENDPNVQHPGMQVVLETESFDIE